MVDARVGRQVKDKGRPSPVTLLEYLPIRRGSGDPQEPFSSLSEVYSPSILHLVSRLVSLTSPSSVPPCPRVSLVRADIP
jgi:hypothetical protein